MQDDASYQLNICFNHRPTARMNAPMPDHHFFLQTVNHLIVLVYGFRNVVQLGFNPCDCHDDLVQLVHFDVNLRAWFGNAVDVVNLLMNRADPTGLDQCAIRLRPQPSGHGNGRGRLECLRTCLKRIGCRKCLTSMQHCAACIRAIVN